MKSKKHLVWVAGVLALIAAWTSGSLLLLHAEKDADLGLLAAVCSATEDGCASVVNSRWGVLPPGEKGSDGPHDGFPVAALGFLYYALLASWYLLIGIPDPGRMWLSRMVLYLNALGVVGSIIYTSLIFFAIGTVCTLCLLTHACNIGIFIVSWLLRPRQKEPRGGGSPSNRLLAASAATLLLACVAQWGVFEAGQERARFQSLEEEVLELRVFASDVEKVDTVHRLEKKNVIEVRDDDPIIDDVGGYHYQLVIFSDVECPNCGRFDEYLKQTILPIWNGHLEVVWKHYPNTSEHPNAMPGARALEAARLQGKFWQLRDWLLPRRQSLGVVNWSKAATELAMDADRFLKDMQSAQVTRRIGQDISLARKLGVRGTPGVYLSGRLVSRLMRRSAGFWKIQSESLREFRISKGQDW